MADFIQTLVSAALGGLMVIAGQYVQDHRRQATDERKRREDNLKELITALKEHDHYFDVMGTNIALLKKDIKPFTTAAIISAYAIAKIYFHELVEPIDGLASAARNYEEQIAVAVETDLKDTAQVIAGSAYIKYRDTRKYVWQKVGECIKRELPSKHENPAI
jgi:hypothetical protein